MISILNTPLRSRPTSLRPEPAGYWKHPPLPAHHTTAHLRFEPAGYWKHPPVPGPAHIHAATTAAMTGGRIALIAVLAVLLTLAVLAVRQTRVAQRPTADVA